jgi:hypothetical protein
MGIVGALMGNAGIVDAAAVSQQYAKLFGSGEQVLAAYCLIRDMFIFTDRRLLLVDYQGMSGKKVEYMSIPYKSIVRFSVETAGTFDLDAELKIWTSGMQQPIQKQFNKKVDIYELQAYLAYYVCCR